MDAAEANRKFKLADQMYREGRYGQALAVLDALDEEFPDTRRVMFPRAMCLARLQRYDDALTLCDEIIDRFQYARAEELKNSIQKERAGAAVQGVEIPDLNAPVIVTPPARTAPEPLEPDAKPWFLTPPVLIGATVLVCIVAASIALFALRGEHAQVAEERVAEAPAVSVPSNESLGAADERGGEEDGSAVDEIREGYVDLAHAPLKLVLVLLLNLVAGVAGLYVALMVCGKLPHDRFLPDLGIITGVTVVIGVESFVCALFCPCIGSFLGLTIAITILHKLFDLGFMDFLVLFVVNFLLGIAAQGASLAIIRL
jgi:hypothetical protein